MMIKKKDVISFVMLVGTVMMPLASCQESFEEKAQRDAMEYTRKYCPTPVINYMRTDSVTFEPNKRLYTYFCSFVDIADNQDVINENKTKIAEAFRNGIKESVIMKQYLDKNVRFRMVGRSGKDSRKVLFTVNL